MAWKTRNNHHFASIELTFAATYEPGSLGCAATGAGVGGSVWVDPDKVLEPDGVEDVDEPVELEEPEELEEPDELEPEELEEPIRKLL